MGGADTGKTTLVEGIADFLSKSGRVGLVDLDMGQSHIGPPTTIAWGKITEGFRGWPGISIEDFYFTGAVTPFGSLLPSVVAAKLMTEKALTSCKKVVVDTTGLIAEPVGRVLKQFKIDILSPDLILALEYSGELKQILDAFRFHRSPEIHRLIVPAQVKRKAIAKRSQYRFEKFKGYFKGSHILKVPVEAVGIRFLREPSRFSLAGLKNRVISFRDKDNKDISLGYIEGLKQRENRLLIRTPMSSNVEFSAVVIGRAVIDVANLQVGDRA